MTRARSRAPAGPAGAFLLALFLGAASGPPAAFPVPPDVGIPVPLPAMETENVLGRWLSESGFEVLRESTADGGARLAARQGDRAWEIIVLRDSPLASRVRARLEAGGKDDPSAAAELRAHLDRYVRGGARDGNPAGVVAAPPAVRERLAAAVCLSASRGDGETIRFSGVVVDGRGTVVSTAHDLDDIVSVTVRLGGRGDVPGRLVRKDASRDLSVIRLRGGAPAKVSLAGARDVLARGETVFAIGCAGDTPPLVRAGFVSGAPRKVGDVPVWPVEMETLPGSSGGPVFDRAGAFVGVVKGRYRGTESQGYVIPARTIAEFLKETPAP